MPLKLAELLNHTAPRSFEYAGETVNLELYTQKLTPAYRVEWQRISADPDRESRCQLIADFVASWDVQAEDGSPEKVTYEFLQRCPESFLNTIVGIVEEALFPSAENPTPAASSLSSGSQPEETPQAS